jgi:glucosamine-phosphate N-acetyltransferase
MPIRSLTFTDYNLGFLDILRGLTTVGSVSYSQFEKQLLNLENSGCHAFVMIEDTRMVAVGTLLVEPKFIHENGTVAHIEDVAVHPDCRRMGYGTQMVNFLKHKADSLGCYKCILNCEEKYISFYKSVGFKQKCIQMATYFEHLP